MEFSTFTYGSQVTEWGRKNACFNASLDQLYSLFTLCTQIGTQAPLREKGNINLTFDIFLVISKTPVSN